MASHPIPTLTPVLILPWPTEACAEPLLTLLATSPTMGLGLPIRTDHRYLGYLLRWCGLLSTRGTGWEPDAFTTPAMEAVPGSERIRRIPFEASHILGAGDGTLSRAVFRRVWEAYCRRQQQREPAAIYHVEVAVPQVLDLLVEHNIPHHRIFVTQDPREVWTALWAQRGRTGLLPRHMSEKDTPFWFASRWVNQELVQQCAQLAALHKTGQDVFVTLADLTTAPGAVASRLSGRFQSQFDPEPVRAAVAAAHAGRDGATLGSTLPADVEQVFAQRLGQDLRALGHG